MESVEGAWTEDDGTYKIYKKYGREIAGNDIGYWFSFQTQEGEQVELQMGVSFVSCAMPSLSALSEASWANAHVSPTLSPSSSADVALSAISPA